MLINFITKLAWKEPKVTSEQGKSSWVLYSNRSSNKSRRRDGIILERPKGVIMEHSLCFDFQMTNNQVKYEALIIRLKLAKAIGAKSLTTRNNSQLVVGQVNKMYEIKVSFLAKYMEKLKGLLENFEHFKLERIL